MGQTDCDNTCQSGHDRSLSIEKKGQALRGPIFRAKAISAGLDRNNHSAASSRSQMLLRSTPCARFVQVVPTVSTATLAASCEGLENGGHARSTGSPPSSDSSSASSSARLRCAE